MLECINWDKEQIFVSTDGMDRLIDCWLTALARRVKPITVESYSEKIVYFRRYLEDQEFEQIGRDDIEEFGLWLSGQKTKQGNFLGYHTRNDALRRLRSFLLWAFREDYLAKDFSYWVPKADGSPPQRVAPTLSQLNRLIDGARMGSWPEREVAIIAVLAGTGIRRIEAARLNIEDIQYTFNDSGYLLIQGKRDKTRLAVFDSAAGAILARYLEARDYPTTGPLFVSRVSERRLGKRSFNKIVSHSAKLSSLSEVFDGCHSLRRLFITHWMNRYKGAGYDDLLRRQVGHESIEMTKLYNLQTAEDIHRIFISPLSAAIREKDSAG